MTSNQIPSLSIATLTANASKSASAGLMGQVGRAYETTCIADLKSPSNFCLHSSSTAGDSSSILDSKLSHQIGTNLTDLSVCWHKMENFEACRKCGKTLYDANQTECVDCSRGELVVEEVGQTLSEYSDSTASSSLLWSGDETSGSSSNEQTRRSFQEEFSSLIIKSDNFKSFITSAPETHFGEQAIIPVIKSNYNRFSNKELIEQISLFNKYNTSRFTELTYELIKNENDSELSVRGMIKIHWNLKNPIKLSIESSETTVETMSSRLKDETNPNNFKATSLRDLNKKKQLQTSWDDSSVSSDDKSNQNALFRSQTVKCRPNAKKRAPILDKIVDQKEEASEENQMFVPSYGSVSSICIDNSTTCLKAISILFDKFQIMNSANEFSLYKVYQNGDVKELDDNDMPLMERLWMGPFSNEDRMFIMEKGRQLGVKQQEATSLICLPREFLTILIEKSNQEELKEIAQLKSNYKSYSESLKARLKD